jgi:hypothetical protein
VKSGPDVFADALVLCAAAEDARRSCPNPRHCRFDHLRRIARRQFSVSGQGAVFPGCPAEPGPVPSNALMAARRPGHPIAAMVIASRNATVNQIPQMRGNPHDKATSAISSSPAPNLRLRRIHRDI